MNNDKKKTNFPVILLIIAAGILGTTVYFVTGTKEKNMVQNEKENNIKEEPPKPLLEQPERIPEEEKHIIHEQQEANQKPPVIDQQAPPPNQPPKNEEENSARFEQAMKKQVPLMYEDLFKELNLPDAQRQQVETHLAKSMKSEADFNMKLLDPSLSVDDLLKEQDRLAKEKQTNLTGILKPNEQDLVSKHQDELPKKALKNQIGKFVESLNLVGNDKENVAHALEQAMQKAEVGKKIGQYTAQDINDLRKQFAGAKPGDPEFMRASIENSSKRVSGLLKDLEHLPKEQYEAIKKQMEAPLEMMRQGLEQQQQGMPQQPQGKQGSR